MLLNKLQIQRQILLFNQVESQKQAQQLQNVGGITNDVPDNVKEEDPDNIDGGLDAN